MLLRSDVRSPSDAGPRRARRVFFQRSGHRRPAGSPWRATTPFAHCDLSSADDPPAVPLADGHSARDSSFDDVPTARRALYLKLLNWCFTGFNSTRIVTYVPTMWAIHVSGDSSQHSMLTWLAWVGANSSMAAWLYEHNGRCFNKAIAVNLGNALMCLLTCVLIGWYR